LSRLKLSKKINEEFIMYLLNSSNANTRSLKKQTHRWALIVVLSSLFVGCATQGRNQDVYGLTQGQGIVATGYAVISSQHGDTPAQKRLMAIKASKLDAYRALTEQVYGQYVNATGTMVDMSITQDQMRSRVEGVIYGAKLVSITPIGDETYETKLALGQETINELVRNYLQVSKVDRSSASPGR
jgi:hypothetical protein|tara:strand:+ start:82 stop:636 length:555 start_codon:yes stop_codon:yes gene_type:complete